jgi:hypothetical protein
MTAATSETNMSFGLPERFVFMMFFFLPANLPAFSCSGGNTDEHSRTEEEGRKLFGAS